MNIPSLQMVDILDRILSHLYQKNEAETHQDLKRIVFNSVNGQSLDALYNDALSELKSLNYVEYHTSTVWLTFHGKKFFQTPFIFYKHRPFRFERFKQRGGILWNIVKVIAAVANAVAIIYLAWLAIKKQDESNQKQFELQAKQLRIEANDAQQRQETINDQFRQNLQILNNINTENTTVNQPYFKIVSPSAYYLPDKKAFRLDFTGINIGKRSAVEISINAFFQVEKIIGKGHTIAQEVPVGDEHYFSINAPIISNPEGKIVILTLTITYKDIGNSKMLRQSYKYSSTMNGNFVEFQNNVQ